jgi:hypothetical protein
MDAWSRTGLFRAGKKSGHHPGGDLATENVAAPALDSNASRAPAREFREFSESSLEISPDLRFGGTCFVLSAHGILAHPATLWP